MNRLNFSPFPELATKNLVLRKISDEDMRKNEVVLWGITLKGDDKVIGSICYWNILEDELKAEIGYEH